jgi:hypothetical protein
MTEPDATPQTYGAWRLIGAADPSGKRMICRCSHCGSVKTVGRDALMGGGTVVCTNCQPSHNIDAHGRTFAAGLAASESRSARKRHQGRGDG